MHGTLALRVPRPRLRLNLRAAVITAAALVVDAWQLLTLRRQRTRHRRVAELEAAKTEMLQVACHELRRPLSLARGYVEMVAAGNLGEVKPRAREALQMVADRLAEMDELVGEMSESARLGQVSAKLPRERVDLRAKAREAIVPLRPLLDPKYQLVLDLAGQPVPVEADPIWLRRLVSNLIENAIKYSPEGGEVRCSVRSASGQARLSVSDQGLGLDPEAARTLFSPFTRLDRTAKLGRPGLGLGLYLCREIARAHGGELIGEPNRRRGSTFTLSLPLAGRRQA